MIDKNGTILRNLEDQVQYLTDINQLASLGFRVRGKVDNSSQLVVDDRCVNGDVMLVGTDKPYHLWVFVTSEWVDLGEFPRRGLPGVKGERGESIVGPRGEKGEPSQIPGPAGKNGDGLGVNYITKLDLSTNNPSIAYDKTKGATLAKSGQITAAEQKYDINVIDKLPIIPGDNIDIYTNGTNSALKIGAKVPVTSVNGQKGDVRLTIPTSTSQLVNDAEFITAEYHDNTKQDNLVSGQNIKTINNQSILGSGNISISGSGGVTSLNGKTGAITLAEGSNVTIAESGNTLTISASGGGGGGTDTGFDNVREIQAADDQTTYNPDTKEYLISSGTARVFYKDNTSVDIPYVQEIGLMAGDNITFTEEFVDNANWRVKINATGGGGGSASDGFNNLKELILTPSTYVNNTPAGDFYFEGNGTFKLKDSSSSTGIESIKVQLPVVPGDGITFTKTTDGSCEISLKDIAVLDLGEFSTFPASGNLTNEQTELIEKHSFSFVKFSDPTGWNNTQDLYVYCVPTDNATGHGGITYKSITTQGNTYTVTIDIQRTTGGAIQSNSYSVTKEATPGGGGGSSDVQQTNGFYQYNAAVTASPTVNSTYSYSDSETLYPTGCSYFYGQMIIDTNGAIYRVIGSSMCTCVYVPQGGGSSSLYQHTITMQGSQYKYNITVVNSYQGSITGSSIWKEVYGTNKFATPAIVTDSMDKTVSISSVYVGINPMNALSILFFPSNGSSQHSETISSSATWEDNIISF